MHHALLCCAVDLSPVERAHLLRAGTSYVTNSGAHSVPRGEGPDDKQLHEPLYVFTLMSL